MTELQQQLKDLIDAYGVAAIIISLSLTSLSVAVGQGLLLLANQVKASRFVFSLLASAVIFMASLGVWTAMVYLVAEYYFQLPLTLWQIFVIVVVSFSPLTQAYLGILPYFGSCIVRLLYLQSGLLLLLILGESGSVGRERCGCCWAGWPFWSLPALRCFNRSTGCKTALPASNCGGVTRPSSPICGWIYPHDQSSV